jgi:cyclophilin family peptidyl-prolyl cis-trans isomerase
VPTEKRERQKQGRRARLEARRKVMRRQMMLRRSGIVVVVAAVVGGSVFLIAGGGSSTTTTTTTTTTSSTTTTTTIPKLNPRFAREQAAANAVAVAAHCPRSPYTQVNTLSWKSLPPTIINPARAYTAVIKTDVGTFTVALDAAHAPTTVNNFVFLAKKGYYRCNSFFRVIPGFASQAGSPDQTNTLGAQPGYSIPDENMKSTFTLGQLAMANSSTANSGAAQFFIVDKNEQIMGTYALFGHVSAGLAVVEKIARDGSSGGVPPNVVHRILSIMIIGPTT